MFCCFSVCVYVYVNTHSDFPWVEYGENKSVNNPFQNQHHHWIFSLILSHILNNLMKSINLSLKKMHICNIFACSSEPKPNDLNSILILNHLESLIDCKRVVWVFKSFSLKQKATLCGSLNFLKSDRYIILCWVDFIGLDFRLSDIHSRKENYTYVRSCYGRLICRNCSTVHP